MAQRKNQLPASSYKGKGNVGRKGPGTGFKAVAAKAGGGAKGARIAGNAAANLRAGLPPGTPKSKRKAMGK